VKTPQKFTILLYDASWGRGIIPPAENDPVYQFTSDYSQLPHADVVLFHVPTALSPSRVRKYPGQKWVAFSLESEVNYPQLRDPEYMAQFDFTMTYRWDSDVPLMNWQKTRSLLLRPARPKTESADAVSFSSNLQERSGRTEYLRELMRYLKVDCYGRTFRNRQLAEDRGHESKLETLARYRFDLAFENSLCEDYVSEKFFDPLVAGCVPVYRGAPNIEEFAPGDHCYINTADFHGPRELAAYLRHLAKNPAEYEAFLAWKERPLREGFLKKIEIAEKDPFRRLAELLLASGCSPGQRLASTPPDLGLLMPGVRMSQAIELLQAPDTAAADCLESVLRVADSHDPDLVLIAAAIYARPDCLPPDIAARLTGLLAEPALPTQSRGLAREILEFLLATPLAPSVLKQVTALASQPGLSREVYEELCRVLEYAALWAGPLLDLAAVVAMAEGEHLRPYRDLLCEHVIEPALHACGESADLALLERMRRLYGKNPGLSHLLYTLNQWRQFPAEVREWAGGALRGHFPWHGEAARRLSGEGRRVLVIHNINDAQGDEIVRWVPLVQAFLDFNPKLEAVVVTRRVYLGAHPRIAMVPIADRRAVDEALRQPFDAVIDFFEPNIVELNHDVELESRIQAYVRERKPFLFASATKGFQRFIFERVELDGRAIAESAGLNVQRAVNIYETTSRLIAELGLPLRCGEDPPVSEFVLAGLDWPEARMGWRKLMERNTAGRPVAMMNAFGGTEKLKGFAEATFEAAAAEIQRLAGEGYFVVLIPNGTAWGTAACARELADRIPAECRKHVAIAPDPAGSEELHEQIPGAPPLRHPDYVMRQFFYFARYADLIVTVEGWLMHVAWCLGKPYRVLMAPYSHPQEWHPYARTRRQGVESLPAQGSGRLDYSAPPPLVEQPRKFILLFLLREFGNGAETAALPLLRKALASSDRHLRRAAAEALAKFCDPEATKELPPLLEDTWCGVRAAAAEGLLQRPDAISIPQANLLAHLYFGQAQRNWRSVIGLGEAARPALEAALRDDDPVVRREALQARLLLDFQTSIHQRRLGRRPTRSRISDLIRLLLTPRRDPVPKPVVRAGTVLILTPVKDAAACLDGYCERLRQLAYPHGAISLGFLESDSSDETFQALSRHVRRLRKEFRRVGLWKKDFGYQVPTGIHRGVETIQEQRRAILAKSRNHLLAHALEDEEWVLWLDVDVIEYPPDIIERLMATGKDLVQPHCVLDYRGPTFDKNAWRDHGRLHLDDLRAEGDLVELDAVGGTMLLVRADLHRDGLVFPSFPYGEGNPLIREGRGELETEGLGMMARDMGHRCWGMPNLEIRHGRW
jgi:hypothetical protein